jgi:hypothetical protein
VGKPEKREAFERAETLRGLADAAYARGSEAHRHLNSETARHEDQVAHELRMLANGEYARTGVRLTPLGKPFGPDVRELGED